MKINSLKSLVILTVPVLFIIQGCGKDSSTAPEPLTILQIIVKSSEDSLNISGANVVLYNADNGEAVSRVFSGSDGAAKFEAALSGNFYVRISAQQFNELPEESVSPVPFSLSSGQIFSETYYMKHIEGIFGRIDGTVVPKLPGFLIAAANSTSGYHSYSGPDGYFVIFNVPYGTYTVNAVKSGYQLETKPEVTISSSASSQTIQINLIQYTGSVLSGRVTFLSAVNGIVDISLLDESSLSVITGLTTRIDSNRSYVINNIPNGSYTAWASYENDGYVMDPDWLFKNPGGLNVSFSESGTKSLDFSVTDAISILSPTNPPGAIIPAVADSVIPEFHWNAYPQAKEYIIEVKDLNGNVIWGGFTSAGEIKHSQIPKEWNDVRFNFDGTALSGLNPGDVYQWRVYADDDASGGVQTLLSSSEDLMGLFIVPGN
jgi:hypothetical protein